MEKILKLQLAIFFDTLQSRPDNLITPINLDMGNLFNAMPHIMPLPIDAPYEIPRVLLRSEDNQYNCNISLSRIDFILNGNYRDETKWPDITKDFMAKVRLFVKSVYSRSNITRFGLIGNFFIPDKQSSKSITKKYLKVDLASAEEINLRFNKRVSYQDINLNSVTSINTIVIENNGVAEKGILIELDINNIPIDGTLKCKNLLQIVENEFPNFSPDKVKELVK